MKKLSLYVFLVLMVCNNVNADLYSKDKFTFSVNPTLHHNKPRTKIPKSFFILNIVYKFLHVEFFINYIVVTKTNDTSA